MVAVVFGLGVPKIVTIHQEGGLTETAIEPRALTSSELIASIAQLLAGREAEQLVLGDVTAGAGGDGNSDSARATTLALALEGSFGLGSLGPLWLGPPRQLIPALHQTQLGARVRDIIQHAGSEARRALSENRDALERLGKALFVTSYLDATQIQDAMGSVRSIVIRPLLGTSNNGRDIRDQFGETNGEIWVRAAL